MRPFVVGLASPLLIAAVLITAGCEEEGTFEEAGEEIDEAVEEAGDAIEDAGDEVEDATDPDDDGNGGS